MEFQASCQSQHLQQSHIFNIMQGQERPSETDDSQAIARAAWDAANQDLFSTVLFDERLSLFRPTEI